MIAVRAFSTCHPASSSRGLWTQSPRGGILGRRILGCGLLSVAAAMVLLTGGVRAQESATGEVTLRAGTWKDVEAIIRKNAGKVVVVDIWSTSCLPCMAEFPHLVELQKAHPKDVVCVSLNVDYVGIRSKPVETYRERVEKFLIKKNAVCQNILCTQEADELFDSLKLASIPAVYVYGKDGKLSKRFDASIELPEGAESFTYQDHINPLVESLLGGS